jgi:hypothetical protein
MSAYPDRMGLAAVLSIRVRERAGVVAQWRSPVENTTAAILV